MSIELESTFPPQPSTQRARRTPLSYDANNDLIAYGSGKQVILRSVAEPEKAFFVYGEHICPVTTVAFSPSGFYVASGDQTGQVRVWNTTGEDTVTKGPYYVTSGRLNGVAWCSESSRILAVGNGKERYGHGFTADSGNTIGEISGHSGEVNAVAIKPNRPMRAVSVGEDGNVVFYEGPPFRFLRSTSKHTSFVSDVSYSPNGSYFVSGGHDRKLGLYDGKTGDFLEWLETGHEGIILSVAFASPTQVLSASADCTVRLTDITTKKLIKIWTLSRELQNQQTGVVAVQSKDKDLLAVSVSLSGDLFYWSEKSDEPIRVVQGHQKSITALICNSKSQLFTGSIDGCVVGWSKTGEGHRLTAPRHNGPVSALVGDLWSVGWDNKIVRIGHDDEVRKTVTQPLSATQTDKHTLVLGDQTLELVGSGSTSSKSVSLQNHGTSVHAVGDVCAIGMGNTAVLYKLPTLKELYQFDSKQSDISVVRISPDGDKLAVGEANGKITLYSIADKSILTTRWAFHTSRVTSISWSSDSSRVVTGSSDTNIYIYNVERPSRNIKVLGAHKDGVTQVIWNGSNEIISGGADASIKIWKVK